MSKEEELIQKIKALANEGVAGERENAQQMLERLCAKYNISLDSLDDEQLKDFDISWKDHWERTLLSQVKFSVIGNIEDDKGLWIYKKSKNKGFLRCTKAEFLEIQAKFNFYKYHWKKDLQTFYDAWVQKNNIFPPKNKVKPSEEDRDLTEDDLKVLKLACSLDRHDYNKQITQEATK